MKYAYIYHTNKGDQFHFLTLKDKKEIDRDLNPGEHLSDILVINFEEYREDSRRKFKYKPGTQEEDKTSLTPVELEHVYKGMNEKKRKKLDM